MGVFLDVWGGGGAFFWHFLGKLVNGEGHGAIILDFLARINSWQCGEATIQVFNLGQPVAILNDLEKWKYIF